MGKFTIKKEDTTICDKCLSYDVVSISFDCLPDVSAWSSGGRTFVFPELSAKDTGAFVLVLGRAESEA